MCGCDSAGFRPSRNSLCPLCNQTRKSDSLRRLWSVLSIIIACKKTTMSVHTESEIEISKFVPGLRTISFLKKCTMYGFYISRKLLVFVVTMGPPISQIVHSADLPLGNDFKGYTSFETIHDFVWIMVIEAFCIISAPKIVREHY